MAASDWPHARRLLRRLESIRRTARLLLALRVAGWLIAGVLAAAAAVAGLDYLLRLPGWVRLVALAAAVATGGWYIWRKLAPALRMRPTLVDVALRLERAGPALRGQLASAVDMARAGDHRADRLVRRMAGTTLPDVLRRRPTYAAAACAVALLAGWTALAATSPQAAGLAAERILLPLGTARWPSRTEITLAQADRYHPLGQPLPLRGVLTRTDQPEGRTRVDAWYRLGDGPATRIALTAQGPDPAGQGELYERLVNPLGPARASTLAATQNPGQGQQLELTYWLQTKDDTTEPATITLVRPPRVLSVAADVTPPPYAAPARSAAALGLGESSGRVPIAIGRDGGGSVGPILAGSAVTLQLRLSKPADVLVPDDAPPRADPEPRALQISPGDDGRTATLSLRPGASRSLVVELRDEYGVASAAPLTLTLEVTPDADPTAAVVLPSLDESVLATARIDLAGEARDDVGLSRVTLEAQPLRPPAGSMGAPPEPDGQAIELATLSPQDAPLELRVGASADMDALDLRPGDELWVRALAADLRGRPVAASSPRKLRIIAESVTKNDRFDAAVLADLTRADLRLPTCYLPDDEEFALREHLRARHDVVTLRTRVKNRIHSVLHRRGILVPLRGSLFTQAGRTYLESLELDEAGRSITDRYLQLLDQLEEVIESSTRQLRSLARRDRWAKSVALLQSIPGVGLITSLTILAELGDLNRFPRRASVANYVGLVPVLRSSNECHRSGHITKRGSKHLRAVLIEAAWMSVPRVPRYQAMFDRVSARRGRKIAIVGVARRMLEDAWTMLKKDEAFRMTQSVAG